MYKKVLSLLFGFVLLFSSFGQAYASATYLISMNDNQTINISSTSINNGLRVLVEKDDQKYYYSLGSSTESLPLQLGTGKYDVKVLEKVNGNKYKVLSKKSLNLNKFDEKEAFLTSAQPVEWTKNGQEAKLAKDLTKDLVTDREKIEALYDYIVKNISYDFNKIKGLNDDYVPNNEDTLKTLSGICYDYASLFGAMLRSLEIPTKLVKGYKNDLSTYHAWNEVLIDENWVIIDTTYDSAFVNANRNVSMIKLNSDYNKVREY
ncbi:MAG: transglutaminase domain-containing protein [Tissierella sp.]|nr:transglutaminase domain-containing protein [Tissierella sp.]